ncbi:hypothetical protein Moror_11069 [Moniliophthora roreri MCA 2997]|uniref:Uncharacterized protein n=1 Tax=Moniliophthora roreri (strain MCA 2997) TaxID=1381753 RepID=V2WS67_MONRO|nr:hypothetical protein Moror_11069 [Moniliophthora roreri MCA 2997]
MTAVFNLPPKPKILPNSGKIIPGSWCYGSDPQVSVIANQVSQASDPKTEIAYYLLKSFRSWQALDASPSNNLFRLPSIFSSS